MDPSTFATNVPRERYAQPRRAAMKPDAVRMSLATSRKIYRNSHCCIHWNIIYLLSTRHVLLYLHYGTTVSRLRAWRFVREKQNSNKRWDMKDIRGIAHKFFPYKANVWDTSMSYSGERVF